MSTEEGSSVNDLSGFVPAVMARDLEEAARYRDLLDDHDIPSVITSEPEPQDDDDESIGRSEMTHGVPVLVPEVLLDEASEIVAGRQESSIEFGEDDLVDDDDDDEYGFEELEEFGADSAEDLFDDDEFMDDEDY